MKFTLHPAELTVTPAPGKKIILETVVGSTLHGTSVSDGLEDMDLMAVALEKQPTFMGFTPNDTWTHRTKPQGVRSKAGDTDWVCYGLYKYLRLSLKGNPTVLLALFAPSEFVRVCTPEGFGLRMLAPAIISKAVYAPFRGYMKQQRERLIGTRGQMNVTRPELIERYGYDTKYAAHVVRLGLQGEELLTTGRLTLPMPPDQRELCVDVRTGKYLFADVLSLITAVEARLDSAFRNSPLPDKPDVARVQSWMLDMYLLHWNHVAIDSEGGEA